MLVLLPALALTQSRIGHATRTQILAVLPPVLRKVDPPDPAGEARYTRLVKLADGWRDPVIGAGLGRSPNAATLTKAATRARPLLAEADGLLRGSLRRSGSADALDFPRTAGLKALAKIIALCASEAARQGDRKECVRDVELGLRLSDRLVHADGGFIDLMVAMATEAIAERTALESDAKGGLDPRGRNRVLALLSPLRGPMPEMASALRQEFRDQWLPTLIDAIHDQVAGSGPSKPWYEPFRPSTREDAEKTPAGSYDPIATARLLGRIVAADIADSQRPLDAQTGLGGRLAKSAAAGVPDMDDREKADYHARMDAAPNSIGWQIASLGHIDSLAVVAARRAATRNLTRAAILLRHGEPAVLPDPFDKGPLKVDSERRIVYSVGENGKDDGGQIGKGFGAKAPDMGYRY